MRENRHFHRVKFNCFVEFETSECCHVCELTINLDESGDVQIIMLGTSARKIENRLGIYCTSIDADSMAHLRKLVEYNLGDSELANRDFDALTHHRE